MTSISRLIRHEHATPDGVRVTVDGVLVVIRCETSTHAIPVCLSVEQARELARVIEAFATVADSQESEIL